MPYLIFFQPSFTLSLFSLFSIFSCWPMSERKGWFELGLHLHVCFLLHFNKVQYRQFHKEPMTLDVDRASQIGKFLTSIIKHNFRNQIAKESIQSIKVLSCTYFLCQASELSSWLIPYSETILLHHWINLSLTPVFCLWGGLWCLL